MLAQVQEIQRKDVFNFWVFSHILLSAGHDVPEEVRCPLLILSVKSCHAALTALFLSLSIISTAFAVCISKKIHRISVFLFRAFILDVPPAVCQRSRCTLSGP